MPSLYQILKDRVSEENELYDSLTTKAQILMAFQGVLVAGLLGLSPINASITRLAQGACTFPLRLLGDIQHPFVPGGRPATLSRLKCALLNH